MLGPARTGAGRVHQPRAARARRPRAGRRDRRPRRHGARRAFSAAALETADGTDQAQRRDPRAQYAARPPAGSPAGSSCASSPPRCDRGDPTGSRRSSIERNELVPPMTARCALGRPANESGSRPAWCCARSAIVGTPLPGVPFDEPAQHRPQRDGRVIDPDTRPAVARRVRRRLDQAWTLGGDRDQQEVRAGDDRPAARRLRAGRLAEPTRPRRRAARAAARARRTSSTTRAGRRSTPTSARRESRPAALASSSYGDRICWSAPAGSAPRRDQTVVERRLTWTGAELVNGG